MRFGRFAKFFLVFGVLGFAACGEGKTPRELQQLRNREQIQQRLSEIRPLVGEYEGELFNARSQRTERFRINIVLAGESYDDDKIPDETVAPTLRASAVCYTSESVSGTYITIPFNKSDYDEKTKSLNFFSEDPAASLLMKVLEKRLQGKWHSTSRGMIGEFDVVKVR